MEEQSIDERLELFVLGSTDIPGSTSLIVADFPESVSSRALIRDRGPDSRLSIGLPCRPETEKHQVPVVA